MNFPLIPLPQAAATAKAMFIHGYMWRMVAAIAIVYLVNYWWTWMSQGLSMTTSAKTKTLQGLCFRLAGSATLVLTFAACGFYAVPILVAGVLVAWVVFCVAVGKVG